MSTRSWLDHVLTGAWVLVAAPCSAQLIDVSGDWQVNVDCDYYATATSFLTLSEDTGTGDVTALSPALQGTIEFPTAIERIDSGMVVSGPTTGSVAASGFFSMPASPGTTRSHVTLAPPYDYMVLGCPVAGILIFSGSEGVVDGAFAYLLFDTSLDGSKYVSRYPDPPFLKAKLIRGRVLKVQLDATALALSAPQDALGVRVTTGLLRNCALFSGDGVHRDQAGRFVGKLATAAPLADCSATSLGGSGSPSGAFVDAVS
jgi:hypothetical protein